MTEKSGTASILNDTGVSFIPADFVDRNLWGVVTLMNGDHIVGRVFDRMIDGVCYIQIDVPAAKDLPAYTQIVGIHGVWMIKPTSEAEAREILETGEFERINR